MATLTSRKHLPGEIPPKDVLHMSSEKPTWWLLQGTRSPWTPVKLSCCGSRAGVRSLLCHTKPQNPSVRTSPLRGCKEGGPAAPNQKFFSDFQGVFSQTGREYILNYGKHSSAPYYACCPLLPGKHGFSSSAIAGDLTWHR